LRRESPSIVFSIVMPASMIEANYRLQRRKNSIGLSDITLETDKTSLNLVLRRNTPSNAQSCRGRTCGKSITPGNQR
jgi:hypothetical protein